MNLAQQKQSEIDSGFYNFINQEVLPHTNLNADDFWFDLMKLVNDFSPLNSQLLATRKTMQKQIDDWHQSHQNFDQPDYLTFLKEIGYLVEQGESFNIDTENVDSEISTLAGPQLVVPVQNARFALNAANARWGSLYDAYYGTDVIQKTGALKPGSEFNIARGERVITLAKDFLDEVFPLDSGSHHDVLSYLVYYQHLLAFFPDGSKTGLKTPSQFIALDGSKSDPSYLLLKNNGLHIGIVIDRHGKIGCSDLSGIDDIQVESALTTIMDFEDSISAVDAEDKVEAYKNWLGLIKGDLSANFSKDGKQMTRQLNQDKAFIDKDGEKYVVHGRALLMVRNVGHLMGSDLIQDDNGNNAPEGIIDAAITALIGSLDLQDKTDNKIRNSRSGSIYIVKPKMHGPDEVAFTCDLFSRVEEMLKLQPNTIKLGIMDEERRTSVNLKECIRVAKSRVVFINTGFLDRTGDEIHTSKEAGAVYPKALIKTMPWFDAYENNNVDVGLACGFSGKAQIGKGMWAMPDEMKKMMKEKIQHPLSGANTAWVPSPTAATLHALHYHQVDVFKEQLKIAQRPAAKLTDLLTLPIMPSDYPLSSEEIEKELENNIQGILGYVVRWVEMGIGCSKVPDINNVGLMEDRATLRISSQHIANWLRHDICSTEQVSRIMRNMAEIVDKQNAGVPGYQNMSPNYETNYAFQAAEALIFEGYDQPNGYTEPLLHEYRMFAKIS
jgi:malate synthase